MCTLSWVPGLDGYALAFNRDERRTRPAALPPSVRTIDGVSFLAPADPEGGGTWISVNAAGVTIALANRYADVHPIDPARRESRGRLVLTLAPALDLDGAEQRLTVSQLDRYEGFTLAVIAPGGPAALFSWDGRTLDRRGEMGPGMLIASSAHDERGAIPARRAALDAAARELGWTRQALLRAHTSHIPSMGAHSICMHRDEASTVSLTQIEVDPARISMTYHAGQPCDRPLVARASFPRTSAAIGG